MKCPTCEKDGLNPFVYDGGRWKSYEDGKTEVNHYYLCKNGHEFSIEYKESEEPMVTVYKCDEYPGKGHPWGDFLYYRMRAIAWVKMETGHDDKALARDFSMDEEQVYLIRNHESNKEIFKGDGL